MHYPILCAALISAAGFDMAPVRDGPIKSTFTRQMVCFLYRLLDYAGDADRASVYGRAPSRCAHASVSGCLKYEARRAGEHDESHHTGGCVGGIGKRASAHARASH